VNLPATLTAFLQMSASGGADATPSSILLTAVKFYPDNLHIDRQDLFKLDDKGFAAEEVTGITVLRIMRSIRAVQCVSDPGTFELFLNKGVDS
jgi:hypothetical protein